MMLLIGITAGIIASIVVLELEIRHEVKQMNKNYLLHRSIQDLKMEVMFHDHS